MQALAVGAVEFRQQTEQPQDEFTIAEIAAAALREADNDVVQAAQLMEGTINADERKYRMLMDPLVASACYTAVSQVVRASRGRAWTAPNYTAGGNGSRVKLLSAGNLMMFPLPGGKYLRDANKAEVVAGAAFYEKQGRDMTLKSRFLSRVAEKLGDRTVAAEFTEESLRELQAEVRA